MEDDFGAERDMSVQLVAGSGQTIDQQVSDQLVKAVMGRLHGLWAEMGAAPEGTQGLDRTAYDFLTRGVCVRIGERRGGHAREGGDRRVAPPPPPTLPPSHL